MITSLRNRISGTWSNLGAASPESPSFNASQYLVKWLIVGTLIGIVAGLGAVIFTRAIEFVTEHLLGSLAGYEPPAPIGEGSAVLHSIDRPWVLPLVTTLGGLISGILVFWLAPEAVGHGTDAAIDAIHHKNGRLRPRVVPVKLVSSAITIGSGGSGGREGPAAQISATFGSLLSKWLRLSDFDRRIAVAAGMGAGIGAIFRAPLGGALMAAEILYLHDLEVEALVPGLIASIVGFATYGSIEGWDPIFGSQPDLAFSSPVTLIYYAALGLICGIVGVLYAESFYGTERIFHRLSMPNWLKPALGGLSVGLIGLKVHGALHTGYGWVQIGMTDQLLTLPLWIVLVLPFAKIAATSLSIGSGGSGGIFGPGMVIGGMLGAAFWRLSQDMLPDMPHSPAPFVIIGMMAMFGGIAHAPLAVMLMVAEMTGNLSLLAPAMVAVAVSTALVGDRTIYRSQVPNRSDSPAHRLRLSFPLLSSLHVRDVMRPFDPARPASDEAAVSVSPETLLPEALERLAEARSSEATVLERDQPVGLLTVRDALSTYRRWETLGARRVSSLPSSTIMIEATLASSSPLCGQRLDTAKLPAPTLIASIVRSGDPIFPIASTVLEAGDRLTILSAPEREAAVLAMIGPQENAGAITPASVPESVVS